MSKSKSTMTEAAGPSPLIELTITLILDRECKRHPAVAQILRRDPLFFTSDHASFSTVRKNRFQAKGKV